MAIIIPTPGTVITSAWGKSVADAINALPLTQYGIAEAVTLNSSSGVNVIFPKPFKVGTRPTVVVTTGMLIAVITAVPIQYLANTQCAVFMWNHDNSSLANQQVSFHWAAFGLAP